VWQISVGEALGGVFSSSAPMPSRRHPEKPEPIAFECPSCGAKYIIVPIKLPDGVKRRRFNCLKCDALFPAGEGRVLLEYALLDDETDQ